MASRGPFILLAFVTLCAAVFYLMWAISTRVDIIDTVIQAQVNSALQFLNGVQSAFLPAVILCLIHLRGGVLRASKGNTISPLASQLWKRILDWVLVALTFIFAIAQMGVIATLYAAFEDGSLTDDQSIQLFDASVALGHTFIAFQTLLYVDVIVSLIVHFIQSRRAQSSDLVRTFRFRRRIDLIAVRLRLLAAFCSLLHLLSRFMLSKHLSLILSSLYPTIMTLCRSSLPKSL